MAQWLPLYGDGKHDDTAAIQQRLDSMLREVVLPQPTEFYLISKTLYIRSNQTLQLPRYAEIRLAPNSNCLMLQNADMYGEGNQNVAVIGGIWNFDNRSQDGNPIETGAVPLMNAPAERGQYYDPSYLGVVMRLGKIKNLFIDSLTIKDPATFSIQLGYVDQFTVQNITFDFNHGNPWATNMDGVHCDGGCRNGLIRNLKGACYDDLVALNADDFWYGPITDIQIDGIFSQDCHSAVRLLSAGSEVSRITISNVYGTFFQYAVAFSRFYPERGESRFDQITLRDIYVSKAERLHIYHKDGSYVYPLIWFEKAVKTDTVVISGLHRRESITAVETIGVQAGAEIENLFVANATQSNQTGEEIPFLRNEGAIHNLSLTNISVQGDAMIENNGAIDQMITGGIIDDRS